MVYIQVIDTFMSITYERYDIKFLWNEVFDDNSALRNLKQLFR